MKYSSTLGKFYDLPAPDQVDDERKERDQEIGKMSWLRETPTLLAHRIPNSVFALGDIAGQAT